MMKRPLRLAGIVLASFVFMVGILAAPPAGHGKGAPHWTYEGNEGPEHWGDLDQSFQACKLGHLQSPIDILSASIKTEPLDPIRFDYKPAPLRVMDNGHTEMVTYAPGSTIHIGNAEYELQQVHFHRPSEEKIDGKSFPLVAHLVHKDKQGKLAVVAVLFQEGPANPELASVFGHLPADRNHELAPAGAKIDASGLLPASKTYWTFQGSLTTPPCTEGVTWYVLRMTSSASAEQIEAFAKHYPHNARPVQPVGDRGIRASQ
jgi:carbonic anhydrase